MKTRYAKYLNRNGIPHEIALKQMEQKLKELAKRQDLVQILAEAKRIDLDPASHPGLGSGNSQGELQQPGRSLKSA
jgi:hypothetical protein